MKQKEELLRNLLSLLNDENKFTKEYAANAIGDIIIRYEVNEELFEKALQCLCTLLYDKDEYVRGCIEFVLQNIVESKTEIFEKILEQISPFLDNTDEWVREATGKILDKIVSSSNKLLVIQKLSCFLENNRFKEAAIYAIGKSCYFEDKIPLEVLEGLIEKLTPLLKNESSNVRMQTTRTIKIILECLRLFWKDKEKLGPGELCR